MRDCLNFYVKHADGSVDSLIHAIYITLDGLKMS